MRKMRKGFRIQSVVVYAAIDENGDEGVIGIYTGMGWVPAICADRAREDLIEAKVREIVAETGKKVRKIRMTTRVDEGDVK